MTVLDTKTGAIVAIGGGRNYSGHGLGTLPPTKNVNPVLLLNRFSLMDPPLKTLDWSTGNTVVDEPYNYKGTDKAIRNVDGKYQGTITIREALYNSRNFLLLKF